MRLSFRPIKNWANVNHFEYANQWEIYSGSSNTLYFQIIDLDKDGIRYIPSGTYSLKVIFPPSPGGDSEPLEKTATNPSTLDNSIFSVTINNTDSVYTGNVTIELTQGGVKYYGILRQALVVHYLNEGGC